MSASRLTVGDELISADGSKVRVQAIRREQAPAGETFTTYNIEVGADHTYFVGQTGVWVHNTSVVCQRMADIYETAIANGETEEEARRRVIRFLSDKRRGYTDNEKAKHLKDFYKELDARGVVRPEVMRNSHLAGSKHPVTKVPFDKEGFPIFESFGDVKIPRNMIGPDVSDAEQFKEATRRLWKQMKDDKAWQSLFSERQLEQIKRGDAYIEDLTWHHHQDGKTLQLVDRYIHGKTGHTGGRKMTGGR